MRKLLVLTIAVGLATFSFGCSPKPSTPAGKPSGPGKTPPAPQKTTPATTPDAVGAITLEEIKEVEVEPGKEAELVVAIKRDKYDGEAEVLFAVEGEGVTIEKTSVAEKGESAKATIKTDKDKFKGDAKVTVTVKPKDEKVKPADTKFNIKPKK